MLHKKLTASDRGDYVNKIITIITTLKASEPTTALNSVKWFPLTMSVIEGIGSTFESHFKEACLVLDILLLAHPDQQIRNFNEPDKIILNTMVWLLLYNGELHSASRLIHALPVNSIDLNFKPKSNIKESILVFLRGFRTATSDELIATLSLSNTSAVDDSTNLGVSTITPDLAMAGLHVYAKALNQSIKPLFPARIETLIAMMEYERFDDVRSYFHQHAHEIEESVDFSHASLISNALARALELIIFKVNNYKQDYVDIANNIILAAPRNSISPNQKMSMPELGQLTLAIFIAATKSERAMALVELICDRHDEPADLNIASPWGIMAGVTLGWLLADRHHQPLLRSLTRRYDKIVDLNARPLNREHPKFEVSMGKLVGLGEGQVLFVYAQVGDIAKVKRLCEQGHDVNLTVNNMTLLQEAACADAMDIVSYLLERGADWRAKFPFQDRLTLKGRRETYYSFLHLLAYRCFDATTNQFDHIIKQIKQQGGNLDAFDKQGNKPIYAGADCGNFNFVEAMLLNTTIDEATQKRAIQIANKHDCLEIAQLLREHTCAPKPVKYQPAIEEVEEVEEEQRQPVPSASSATPRADKPTVKPYSELENLLKTKLTPLDIEISFSEHNGKTKIDFNGPENKLHPFAAAVNDVNKNIFKRQVTGSVDIGGRRAAFSVADKSLGHLKTLFTHKNVDAFFVKLKKTTDSNPGDGKENKKDDKRPVKQHVKQALNKEQQADWIKKLRAVFCHAREVNFEWKKTERHFLITWDYAKLWNVRLFNASHDSETTVKMTPDFIQCPIISRLEKEFDPQTGPSSDQAGLTVLPDLGGLIITPYVTTLNSLSHIERIVSSKIDVVSSVTLPKTVTKKAAANLAATAKTKEDKSDDSSGNEAETTPSIQAPILDSCKELFAKIAKYDGRFISRLKLEKGLKANKWLLFYTITEHDRAEKSNPLIFFDAIATAINLIRADSMRATLRTDTKIEIVIKLPIEYAISLQQRSEEMHAGFEKAKQIAFKPLEESETKPDKTDADKDKTDNADASTSSSTKTVMSVIKRPPSPETKPAARPVIVPIVYHTNQLINVVINLQGQKLDNLTEHLKQLMIIPEPNDQITDNGALYYHTYMMHALRLFMTITDSIQKSKNPYENKHRNLFKYWRHVIRKELQNGNWERLRNTIQPFVLSLHNAVESFNSNKVAGSGAPIKPLALFWPEFISTQAIGYLTTALEPYLPQLQAKTLGKIDRTQNHDAEIEKSNITCNHIQNCLIPNQQWKRDALLMASSIRDYYKEYNERSLYRQLGHDGLNENYNVFANRLLQTFTTDQPVVGDPGRQLRRR